MKILIAGGAGFIGRALEALLKQENHEVYILTRRTPRNDRQIQWDGRTAQGWGHRMNEMDAVVNLTGYGLEHWPWTKRQKEKFESSRVEPGRALVSAIETASRRPKVFLQVSGINHYGLRGDGIADEVNTGCRRLPGAIDGQVGSGHPACGGNGRTPNCRPGGSGPGQKRRLISPDGSSRALIFRW